MLIFPLDTEKVEKMYERFYNITIKKQESKSSF